MQVNEKLRELREDRDLKQASIGLLLGVNKATIANKNEGKSPSKSNT